MWWRTIQWARRGRRRRPGRSARGDGLAAGVGLAGSSTARGRVVRSYGPDGQDLGPPEEGAGP